MKLRDYQKDVLRQVSSAFLDGKKGVLLQMATGAGKTVTAGYIVEKYAQTNRCVLWLVHRNELLFQAGMTFSKIKVKHNPICSKQTETQNKVEQFRNFGQIFIDKESNTYNASVQTLVRKIDKLGLKPDLIIADEAHLSLNNTFRTIIDSYPDAKLLGLTATPVREDKKPFASDSGGLYDEMVCGPQTYELIDSGNLCDYDVYKPPISLETTGKIKTKGKDYDPQALEEEFTKSYAVFGDVVKHYTKYSHNLPAIGFCPTIKIAQDFTNRFIEAGYKAVMLEGNTDAKERFNTLQQLSRGEIHVVMSVDILIEGTDVPLATTAICLRKTKSLRIYLQSIGRVLRPHTEKEKAIILDFVGLTEMHGLPDDHREWSLTGEVKRRAKPRELDDDEVVRIQTCPKCFKAHEPAPTCPKCGYEYTVAEEKKIKVVEGDLIKIERQRKLEAVEHKQQQAKARRLEESNCKTFEEWLELGQERNYEFPKKWAARRAELRCKTYDDFLALGKSLHGPIAEKWAKRKYTQFCKRPMSS